MWSTAKDQHNTIQGATQRGFTLVEIIVSFAILAVVATSVVAAVLGMAGVQQRNDQVRADNAAVEAALASDDKPNALSDALELKLGNSTISGTAGTYSGDLSSYTVLEPGTSTPPATVVLDGGAATEPHKQYIVQTTGYYQLEVWGARGGDSKNNNTSRGPTESQGGSGGYATGMVRLTQGTILYLYAGTQGESEASNASGGYNGGGTAGSYTTTEGYRQGGGGGASDVRINTDSMYARVIVAGGGGGAGSNHDGADRPANPDNQDFGGQGGGTTGREGGRVSPRFGIGGTQSSGGATGTLTVSSSEVPAGPNGSFGQGASVTYATPLTGGGGGGGWYGGGAGSFDGGGGGSGWIFTQATHTAWTDSVAKDAYLLRPSHWLRVARLIGGDTVNTIPDPTSKNPDDKLQAPRDNGYVRISWVGTSPPSGS
ncbi:MAG: prepilin-type N-terminal cleavage/methylation domain-containing protein [Coriobacteriales bacterium]|jgi:prepilin-type N-terminal cleavage/methylation domain-containing protein|nr:prepilin-type N-terminal cleavage/methylation domain-containing protein [Coriobacteriales bacterium]